MKRIILIAFALMLFGCQKEADTERYCYDCEIVSKHYNNGSLINTTASNQVYCPNHDGEYSDFINSNTFDYPDNKRSINCVKQTNPY